MNSIKQAEEIVDSEVQGQPSNTVAFNGTVISDIFDVGDGYIAFNIESNSEELPLIIAKVEIDKVKLYQGDKIMSVGTLKKIQNQWVIEAYQINRMPTEEELKKMN